MRNAYDEISPFSGKLSVMCEYHDESNDTQCICFDTGYTTFKKSWKIDSLYIQRVEENLPIHIIQDRKIDDNGNVWYRFIQVDQLVALIPEISDTGTWTWVIYRICEATSDSDPIVWQVLDENNDNKLIKFTCDISSKKVYPDNEFRNAFEMLFATRIDIVSRLTEADDK